jgi:hypothetical protein
MSRAGVILSFILLKNNIKVVLAVETGDTNALSHVLRA